METVKYVGDVTYEPRKSHDSDAGFDLMADVEPLGLVLRAGQSVMVSAGIRAAIPEGHVGLVCPRSGLAQKYGVTVLNAPGIIDAGYRGEWGVLLTHYGGPPLHIRPGDRIAQLVVVKLAEVEFENDEVGFNGLDSDRGDNGFGSTGTTTMEGE